MGKFLERAFHATFPKKIHIPAPERMYWNLRVVAVVPALVFRAEDVSGVMPILDRAEVVAHGHKIVNGVAIGARVVETILGHVQTCTSDGGLRCIDAWLWSMVHARVCR